MEENTEELKAQKTERDSLLNIWFNSTGQDRLTEQYKLIVKLLTDAYGNSDKGMLERLMFELIEAGRESGIDSGIKIGLAKATDSIS